MTTPAKPTAAAQAGKWRLPAPPLRGDALSAATVGGLSVTGLAMVLQWRLQTHSYQPLVAAAIFAAMLAVTLLAMRAHHPFPRLGPANQITMLRAGLAALAASLIFESARDSVAWMLVIVTAVSAALDGLDGWLARRSRMSSVFGARFDMETDAFFMLVLSMVVWRHDKAGMWVLAIGLMRYAFVAAGWLLPWMAQPLRATRRARAVAVAQVVALGVALLPVVPAAASRLVCAAALATLVWSFAIDVLFLWVHRFGGQTTANQKKRARPDGRALDRR